MLINDATLWTCGPKGTLAEWDILFVDGKIEQVAPDITVPQGSAILIEGAGKHVTPGQLIAIAILLQVVSMKVLSISHPK